LVYIIKGVQFVAEHQ